MSCTTWRTTGVSSTRAWVVTSPATTTRPVVVSDSHATREPESWASMASSTASEIWSHILSGWPIETDSEVKSERAAIAVSWDCAARQCREIVSRLQSGLDEVTCAFEELAQCLDRERCILTDRANPQARALRRGQRQKREHAPAAHPLLAPGHHDFGAKS